MFSPPDQKANARREKDELEEKEKARYVRDLILQYFFFRWILTMACVPA